MMSVIVRRQSARPFLAANGSTQPSTRRAEVAASHLAGQCRLLAGHAAGVPISPAVPEQPAQPGLQTHDRAEHAKLPARPVAGGVRQQ